VTFFRAGASAITNPLHSQSCFESLEEAGSDLRRPASCGCMERHGIRSVKYAKTIV
jgi:hypothetical protein